MPAIQTAEEAVDTAERFLDRYHPFRKLTKVVQAGGKWITEFNVSLIGPPEIVHIELDAGTGSVIEYATK